MTPHSWSKLYRIPLDVSYDAIERLKIFGTKLKIERGYVQVLIASEKFIFSESGLVFLNLPVQFPIRAHVFESKSNNKRQQKTPFPLPLGTNHIAPSPCKMSKCPVC